MILNRINLCYWGLFKNNCFAEAKNNALHSNCFILCSFSSRKREIRHLHVVVVQRRQRNVQKMRNACAKLVSVSSTWCLSVRIRQSIRPDSVVSVGDNDWLGFFLFHKEDTERGRLLFWIEKKVRIVQWEDSAGPSCIGRPNSTSSKPEENKRRA